MKRSSRSIKLDSRPLYDQAFDALNRFIESGQYQPGDKLPAEGELAKQLGISRPTLREAFGNLEAHGVIERRHGVGTFVTAPAQGTIHGGMEQLVSLRALAKNAGLEIERVDWVIEMVSASEKLAGKLDLALGAPLIRVQMTAKAVEKGCFIAYMDSHRATKFVDIDDLLLYQKGSLLDYLIDYGEPNLSYTCTNIYAVDGDENIARWLRTDVGQAVQLFEEVYFSDKGQPVAYENNYFVTALDCLDFHIVRRVAR